MKKYLLGVFAVVLAIGFSAFTKSEAPKAEKKQTLITLVYNAGLQSQVASYSPVTTPPSCPTPPTRLCAVRVNDADGNGTISQTEFSAAFAILDANGNGTLNDQSQSANLLKKP